MRFLVFTNTPAQVHVYKNAVRRLEDMGHEVLVLARDVEISVALLEYYDLPYRLYGRVDTTKGSLVKEAPRHFASIVRQAAPYRPDVIFGMGIYSSVAKLVTGAQLVLLTDTETMDYDQMISRRVADAIVTPFTFQKRFGEKHYLYDGFKECAYLHPEVFSPDASVREELGVGPDEPFVVLRFNSWGAVHDIGEAGFTRDQRNELIDRLSEHATVFVSDEAAADDAANDAVAYDIHPARMHDALAEAALLVADTGTMVTEAALLGTPAVRSCSFIGEDGDDLGNFVELERRDLIFNYDDFDKVIDKSVELLTDDTAKAAQREKRDAYMADLVDLTDLLVEVATNPYNLDRLDRLVPAATRPPIVAASGTPTAPSKED